jgi:hypothetical protein
MRSAPAQVVLHAVDDFLPTRLGITQQKTIRIENHAGRAEAALESIMFCKRLLDRMQFSVNGQPLDGKNLLVFDTADGKHARAKSHAVDDDRTRTAKTFPAAVLRSCQTQIGAQDPQKGTLRIGVYAYGFVIELEGNFLVHIEPSLGF